MLLEPLVVVIVDADLVLAATLARGDECRHRALFVHDETLTTRGIPAGEST
jgi:hypothetical protein